MAISRWFYRIGVFMIFAPILIMLGQLFSGHVVYDPNFQSGLPAMTGRLTDFWFRFDLYFITMAFGLITAFSFRDKSQKYTSS